MSFAMCVETNVKHSILAAFKSIESHTCIKFIKAQLAPPANTFAEGKFAVVFSKHGYRYLPHKTIGTCSICVYTWGDLIFYIC